MTILRDFQLAQHNINNLMAALDEELRESPMLLVTTHSPTTGKWGMSRLWRRWMSSTAAFMSERGVTMPLMITAAEEVCGRRSFYAEDAHELFTAKWLGVDADGTRLSWSRKGRDGMRAATKGERFHAMTLHDQWCLERGIHLFHPRDSEYQAAIQDSSG